MVTFVLLGPRMRRLMPEGHSVTEYVRHRFGPVVYYFVLFTVVFYMLTFLTAELTGMAQAGQLIGDVPLEVTSTIIGLLTVTYTAYGGMRASLFTDRIQFYVILPLLVLVIVAGVGGSGEMLRAGLENAPELLSIGNLPGWEFGVVLVIANLSAEMFNQGTWQRVYTVRDIRTLRTGFVVAGSVALPVILLTGLFGIMAVGSGNAAEPSVALLSFVVATMSPWMVVVVLVLAMALVMSSMDTLLNGIVSTITTEVAHYRRSPSMLGHAPADHGGPDRHPHRCCLTGLQRTVPVPHSRPDVRRDVVSGVLRHVRPAFQRLDGIGQQRCGAGRRSVVLPCAGFQRLEFHTGGWEVLVQFWAVPWLSLRH